MKLSPKCLKIFKTLNLYLCFLMLGMCVALPGPCLLDLQDLVQTDTQHIAFIYIARSIGYLLGSVVGGVILDLSESKQAILTFLNLFIGGSMLGIPWSGNLGVLTALMVLSGLSLGAVDIGGNVVCLTLWGKDSAPFYQALHFTFGLGGLISPLVAAPFLGDHSEDDANVTADVPLSNPTTTDLIHGSFNDTLDHGVMRALSNLTTTDLIHGSNDTLGHGVMRALSNLTTADLNDGSDNGIPGIMYPFTIVGVYGLVVTALFLVVCVLDPTDGRKTGEDAKPAAKTSFGLLATLVVLNCALLFVETGTEIGYAQMLTTYAVKGPLGLTTATGSYMTSTFWAAFTVSRLVSVFLAIRVSNFTLIVGDLAVTGAGAAVLLFLRAHEWSLWAASVLLGAGIASFFPAAIGWMDQYVDVTNKIASLCTVGAAFGEMVIPLTISSFIEPVPEVLLYVVAASCVLSSLIVLVLYLILRKRPLKAESQEMKPDPVSENKF